MDFYEVLEKRRTIRDFSDKKIENKIIEKILSAGLKAPTNDHLRNWEFVVVTEKEIIEKVLKQIPKAVSENQNTSEIESWGMEDIHQINMYKDAIPKQYAMLMQSECLILPFFKQTSPLLKPENLSALNDFASIWCCIENILLAASAENLGCALRIPYDDETKNIFETIKHPKEYFMPCYLAIGYPLNEVKKIQQVKWKIEDKIHYNKW